MLLLPSSKRENCPNRLVLVPDLDHCSHQIEYDLAGISQCTAAYPAAHAVSTVASSSPNTKMGVCGSRWCQWSSSIFKCFRYSGPPETVQTRGPLNPVVIVVSSSFVVVVVFLWLLLLLLSSSRKTFHVLPQAAASFVCWNDFKYLKYFQCDFKYLKSTLNT